MDELDDLGVYVISVAAELSGLHPQTLRQYDRLGLVRPTRSRGRGRRYSARDIRQLREITRLSQEEGMNLSGIRRILDLQNTAEALRARLSEVETELAYVTGLLGEKQAVATSPAYRRIHLPVIYEPGPEPALIPWHPPAQTRR